MTEFALRARGLTKQFKIYRDVFRDRVKEKVFFWRASSYYRNFTAVDGIDLEMRKGEVLGIIGPNGAGKTTLLKLFAGICQPTSGTLEIHGTLVAVLALGLGFNPRYTGRENIQVGGCLLGMSLAEIRAKEDWIIDFAELRPFIDQPLRSYSSGMMARLSFSVAAAVSPDILIIDEALATGDAFFVQKSLARIHEICKSGTTAIFVSHNLQQIQRLCSERVILMEKGRIVRDAPAVEVIREYNDALHRAMEEQAVRQRGEVAAASGAEKKYFGNGDVTIDRAMFVDADGQEIRAAKTGQDVTFRLDYTARRTVENVKLTLQFDNYSAIGAFAIISDKFLDAEKRQIIHQSVRIPEGRGSIRFHFRPLLLMTNRYLLTFSIQALDHIYNRESDFLDAMIYQKEHLAELSVLKPNDLDHTRVFEHPVTIEVGS